MLSIATNIVTPTNPDNYKFLADVWINIEDGVIHSITDEPQYDSKIEKRNCICLPGLIDVHVHLSQYDIRGQREPDLLRWLNLNVFPAEQKSQEASYAEDIAKRFYQATLKAGTTTTVVYTAPYRKSCEIAFQVAESMNVRSIIGMTMMDMNCPEYLKQATEKSLQDSSDLCEKWQNKGLLDYIYTPRFALSCTEHLLKETGKLASYHKARIQSHLSENKNEIAAARDLFPEYRNYTDIYRKTGILGNRTIMGHCIHLSEDEIEMMLESDTRIAFCPDSNFFLKSGRFPFMKIRNSGIKIGLGSDVGAGTDLSMFHVMQLSDYTVEGAGFSIANSLYYGTLGAARVINHQEKTGSIEAGKEADLVFIKASDISQENIDQKLSSFIYKNKELEIDSTWVKGRKLY